METCPPCTNVFNKACFTLFYFCTGVSFNCWQCCRFTPAVAPRMWRVVRKAWALMPAFASAHCICFATFFSFPNHCVVTTRRGALSPLPFGCLHWPPRDAWMCLCTRELLEEKTYSGSFSKKHGYTSIDCGNCGMVQEVTVNVQNLCDQGATAWSWRLPGKSLCLGGNIFCCCAVFKA